MASDPLPSVKVNPAHLQEIKSALDDAVKKVSQEPSRATSYHLRATIPSSLHLSIVSRDDGHDAVSWYLELYADVWE